MSLDIRDDIRQRDRMGMCSLGVYTGRGWEACHEFHAMAIIVRKKYGKFLNTNV